MSAADIISEALDEYRMVSDAESQIRTAMVGDMNFRASDQWAADIKADRAADGRPCLTINRIPQFLRQVTNQQRATRPGIQVTPLGGGSTVKTAEVLQGVMRSIEQNSDADVAYANACDHQVTMGRGYWRVLTEYADDDGFEQVIVIRPVVNPFTIFMDAAHTRFDGSDARFAIVIDDIPKHTFKRMYGDDAMASVAALYSVGNRTPDWMPEGSVRVGERYWKEFETERIYSVRMPSPVNPNVQVVVRVRDNQMPKKDQLPEGWTIIDTRDIERVSVKWCKFSCADILEGSDNLTGGRDVPCKYIPIVQVLGDQLNINGKIDLRGMVRDAKDPQSMYSYWASAMTEQIALAPRAPYIGPVGFMRGQETKWNLANRRNYSALEYVPIMAGGQPAPPPQRQQFSADVSSIVQAFQLADNDLKAVMGLYDASLGESGPEQSGKAILARQRQGEVGNSNYLDNLGRAIKFTGRILLDMIPQVYTPIRVLKVLGVDDKPTTVAIHVGAPQEDIDALQDASQGIAGIYDISVGRYAVGIDAGPSFASRRQEAVQSMLQLIQAYPQALPMIGDLLVKNMDWPGAAEIAARLKKSVPAQLLDPGDGQAVDPAAFQQVKQENEDLKKQIETKSYDVKLEIDSKERMAAADRALKEKLADLDNKVELLKLKVQTSNQQQQMAIDAQIAEIERRDATIADHNANVAQLAHQSDQSDQDRQHAAEQAQLDRAHEAQLQQQQLDAQPPASAGA